MANCRSCRKPLTQKRFSNGVLESPSMLKRRKYCDRSCMGRGLRKSVNELTRSGLLVRARRHLKSACEHCGSTTKLGIHHKNRNWRDNSIDNLMTLCASCHTSLHHETGEIVARAKPKHCPACGRLFLKRDRRPETCSRRCGWVMRRRRTLPCATEPRDSAPLATPSCPPKRSARSASSGGD